MLFIATALLTFTSTQSMEPVSSDDTGRVDALIAALEKYEASIVSIAWKQHVYGPPTAAWKRPEWLLYDRSEKYIDERFRWYHVSEHVFTRAPDYVPTYRKSLFFGDGAVRITLDPERAQGMITNPDPFFVGDCSVWRLLGKYTDYANVMYPRPLYERLRNCEGCTLLMPTKDEPWPGVRGVGAGYPAWMDVEVRLDPQYGYAPRLIRAIRQNDKAVLETLVTLEYQQVSNDLWIPRVGLMGANYVTQVENIETPLIADRMADLEAAQQLKGLPPELVRADVVDWVKRLQAITIISPAQRLVCGPLTCFDARQVVSSPEIMIATEISVNTPRTVEEMCQVLPKEAKFFVGGTGRWVQGDQVPTVLRETFGIRMGK